MLVLSRKLLQSEFENKTRWYYLWPKQTYGSIFLMRGADRRIPMHNMKFVTRESNRLINYTPRYNNMIKYFDVEKNEKELNIPMSDVRFNDYRKLFFICHKCDHKFSKYGHSLIRYRKLCPRCELTPDSAVLGRQKLEMVRSGLLNNNNNNNNNKEEISTTVGEGYPHILDMLASESVKEREVVSKLLPSSRYITEIKCQCNNKNMNNIINKISSNNNINNNINNNKGIQGCGGAGTKRVSIRALTGVVAKGSPNIDNIIIKSSYYCHECTWGAVKVGMDNNNNNNNNNNIKNEGKSKQQKRKSVVSSYLGLSQSISIINNMKPIDIPPHLAGVV